jgi:methionyl-tRNA formyltransferase
MRLGFAGTPEFAARALQALFAAGHEVALVLTQPDRPAGRGMQPQASAVKRVAVDNGVPVYQPANLKQSETWKPIAAVNLDLLIVAAYGLILPPAVLELPRQGCLNIHASLLPRWRGAAPIQRAILAGDAETGVCLMGMEAGLDTGPVFARTVTPIHRDDTAQTLHDRLAGLGASLLIDTLPILATVTPSTQAAAGVTYASKLDKSEAPLDWRKAAEHLDRQVRAFNPFPAATARFAGQTLKIWGALPAAASGRSESPGRIIGLGRDGIDVCCGEGVLRLTQVQKPGGKRLPVAAFLAGTDMAIGQSFDLPAASTA